MPTIDPKKPTQIWWVQFQSRNGILPGVKAPGQEGFQALDITRTLRRVDEFPRSHEFYTLKDPVRGKEYFLTRGACLGMRVTSVELSSLSEDWASRLWIGFDPVYHRRWWALPAVGVGLACDAAVMGVYLVPDVLCGLGGASRHPDGPAQYLAMTEDVVGVPWWDRIVPPRLR